MKNKMIVAMILGMLIFPIVSADVLIPTVTNIYFEKNNQPYNGAIDFTVNGYGYSTGIPGTSEYRGIKQPGTYTPEAVFSFSAAYKNSGDQINENYYMNYRVIDYYEIEGNFADGSKFIIKNITNFPVECDENYSKMTCELRINLDNAELTGEPAVKKSLWNSISCFFKKLFGKTC